MKFVQKSGEPYAYGGWCRSVAGTIKEDYREMPSNLRAAMLEALIKEQGSLCAYTMKRISSDSSHVEHIKPESLCRDECRGSDLDYLNMVACFPKEGMSRRYRYGAQEKDNWWENGGAEFVSPLHPNCERRFRFDLEGNIQAVNGQSAAMTTIRVLALDHDTLCEDRRRVIQEYVYGPGGDEPLSVAEASRASSIVCSANAAGTFCEFCIAIRDALAEHVANLARLSQQRRFARRR